MPHSAKALQWRFFHYILFQNDEHPSLRRVFFRVFTKIEGSYDDQRGGDGDGLAP